MFIERNFVWICRGVQAIFVDIFLLVSTTALHYYVMLLACTTYILKHLKYNILLRCVAGTMYTLQPLKYNISPITLLTDANKC